MAMNWNEGTALATFRRNGIEVEVHNGGTHWKLRGHGLVVNCWPTTGRVHVFGKTFFPEPEPLARAMASRRIRLPDEAAKAKCKKCGEQMFWIETDKGKRMPFAASGEFHRCANAASDAATVAVNRVRESLEKIAPGYAPADDVPF